MRRLGHLDPTRAGPCGGEAPAHRHGDDVVAGSVEEGDGRGDSRDLRKRVEAVPDDQRRERTGDGTPHVDDRRVGRDEDDRGDAMARRELDGDARPERAADEDDARRRDAEPAQLRERRLAVGVEPLLGRSARQPAVTAVLGKEDAEPAGAEGVGERQVVRRRLSVAVKVENDGAFGRGRRDERAREVEPVGGLVANDGPNPARTRLGTVPARRGEDHRADECSHHDESERDRGERVAPKANLAAEWRRRSTGGVDRGRAGTIDRRPSEMSMSGEDRRALVPSTPRRLSAEAKYRLLLNLSRKVRETLDLGETLDRLLDAVRPIVDTTRRGSSS